MSPSRPPTLVSLPPGTSPFPVDLLDWPSFGTPLGEALPADQSFPIPDAYEMQGGAGSQARPSSPSGLSAASALGNSSSPSHGGLQLVIGPFQSINSRNDTQRVWVGHSADRSLLTITQGKKFKVTISLLNNWHPPRTYQLLCAIRSTRDTSLKIAGKQLRSGQIADCDRIETEKTLDISFEHSTYLQAPLRLCFFILEPTYTHKPDDSLEKLELSEHPIFRAKVQTEEIEVITSTTWRNRYRPDAPPSSSSASSSSASSSSSSTLHGSSAALLGSASLVSGQLTGSTGSGVGGGFKVTGSLKKGSGSGGSSVASGSATSGSGSESSGFLSPNALGGLSPTSPMAIFDAHHSQASSTSASGGWQDNWQNPAPWRVVIQSLQDHYKSECELDWLKYCVGSKVAHTIDQQSSISHKDFDSIFNNLISRVGPLDGRVLDGLYDEFFCHGWFCGFESDAFITAFLADKPVGSFLVRFSAATGPDPSAYTLAVKTALSPVAYFKTRISTDTQTRAFAIQDDPVTKKAFSTLRSLIDHHMRQPIYRGGSSPVPVPLLISTSLGGAPLEYGQV